MTQAAIGTICAICMTIICVIITAILYKMNPWTNLTIHICEATIYTLLLTTAIIFISKNWTVEEYSGIYVGTAENQTVSPYDTDVIIRVLRDQNGTDPQYDIVEIDLDMLPLLKENATTVQYHKSLLDIIANSGYTAKSIEYKKGQQTP